MNFRPELAEAVMAGTKTVTRRIVSDNPRSPWYRERCGLNEGQSYAVCPGRGKNAIGRVIVTGLRREPLGYLRDVDAIAEGFPDARAFESTFEAINGSYDPHVEVWVVGMRREEAPDA